MKILKQKDYEYMLKCKILIDSFRAQKYFFSRWKQLDPIFEWINGELSVVEARDEFRELSAESLGYSLNRIKDLENNLRIAEHKLKILTDLIMENKEIEKVLTNDSKDCVS